ncbi:Metallo-dependent phosphatase-like protein [Schizophyllum amplum]|uniref:Metallo-dependent phosphatase-like protein n=1 Tax=Schizophyllum amplum TaxID=97359 RepID=A0A550C3M3_9AGAR|nr:Metallo-dependent phosphatase-like protein [Auriculariopsis ampla]
MTCMKEEDATLEVYNASSPPAHIYHFDPADPSSLPPKTPGYTRFIPPGDVLLHAGDLSSYGYPSQLQLTLDWLASLPIPRNGNHDLCLDKNLTLADQRVLEEQRMCSAELKSKGIHYLEHESLTITVPSGRAWKLYGSPAAARYAIGAFQYKNAHEAQEIYDRIPADTEILLTHTPPYCVHDKTRRGVDAGCAVLARRMETLPSCRLHVFGHIHEACGASMNKEGRVSVNAALSHAHRRVYVVDLQDHS